VFMVTSLALATFSVGVAPRSQAEEAAPAEKSQPAEGQPAPAQDEPAPQPPPEE